MQLSDLEADQQTIPVKTNVGNLNVTYRPSVLTPRFVADVSSKKGRTEDATVFDDLCAALSKLLVSWDLYDGERQLGTDSETLKDRPVKILFGIFEGIQEDVVEGEARAPSGAG